MYASLIYSSGGGGGGEGRGVNRWKDGGFLALEVVLKNLIFT